jgi:dephospho-CoA kinase
MRIIGLSGVATSGKDTLCNLISRYLAEKNIETKRIALADKLKEDLKDFLIEKFNVDITKPTIEEKTLVRPILVSYGKVKRSLTKGTYWTNKIDSYTDSLLDSDILPIITDIRYMEYPEDEFSWLKKKNGILVHISRLDSNDKLIPPANFEEKENDKRIKENADFSYTWKTQDDIDSLYYEHIAFLEKIYETIK